ncbi:MAG: HigA family addiction module antitoxin [Janthinobacterium lividum]
MQMHNPPHPGELVREALAAQPELDITRFAAKMGVSRVALSRVLNGKAGISAEMALSLAEVLGTSAELWLNLQVQHDLWHARQVRRAAPRTESANGAGAKRALGRKQLATAG